MEPAPSKQDCLFLTALPVEVRLQIYSYLVAFCGPIKPRQVTPGTKDLSILRTNRQVHEEALSVLYEVNTIVVTRNDFCLNTSPSIQTPLLRPRIHHLHISTFSVSIACTLLPQRERCSVCHPSAAGLFGGALREMPKLQDVTVDLGAWVGSLGRLEVFWSWEGFLTERERVRVRDGRWGRVIAEETGYRLVIVI